MKMDILDSSAWLECLNEGPNTSQFVPIISKHPNLIVPSVIITEIRKVVIRQRGVDVAEKITRSLLASYVIPIDVDIAVSAADIGVKFKLPLADSLIYATALKYKATLWTQDEDFKGLPHVKYFPKSK